MKNFTTTQLSLLLDDVLIKSDDSDRFTRIFHAPKNNEVVRLKDKTTQYVNQNGWMTKDQAEQTITQWRNSALDQYDEPKTRSANNDRIVLSLFDHSGSWSQPWVDAGYQVYRFDIQDCIETGDVNKFNVSFFADWFANFEGQDVYAILAACPCTDFASSGARHFAKKDQDGTTEFSIELVRQTLRTIEYFRPSIWAIENPVGRIEKLTGLAPWRLSFDPYHLGDSYTKKTLIWGRFNANLPIAPVEPTEGSKMHRLYGGKSLRTKNARSVTPEGFSYGFFMANNAADHPVMAIANKYDRIDAHHFEKLISLGVSEYEISSVIDDDYYSEIDDLSVVEALMELAEQHSQALPV